ncbi:hypothetical protein [Natrinema salaciae]|uniref:C2H2-type domain-containing protein n=1 Tax=Natrinema salaciae TaxID=1186196 RepID=A0A1H9S0W3_9EURY|nr:hypothetical protein [Natrinema salaciae]SER78670.1 hypothetical protein SAMN04489841_4539 [Natrinema salaciae]
MATKTAFECPVCHDEIGYGEQLEEHLLHDHPKKKLAGFVATEAVAREEEYSSE